MSVQAQTSKARKAIKPASIVISKARPVTIILPADAILSEETASKELGRYLKVMTGANSQVVREGESAKLNGTVIYLGPTQFAARHLGDKKTFADEEWLLQNVEGKLLITGGRPRGTLYGAYHFLEDVCGVRWWNRWEESVPKRKQIKIDSLQRREKPAFSYRDIYREYHRDWDYGLTAVRARLNRDGDNPIEPLYGGANTYGPPMHSHTTVYYISKEKYFDTHPEWFALSGGKRVAGFDAAQLDYTDPALRVEFLRLLVENIRKSRADAAAQKLPPPTIYAVDQGDSQTWCECPRCTALVQREGSESGPMIDFVNYMADGIKDEFPDVLLSTLAYQKSESPPNTLRPRPNVVVKLTNTTSSYTNPVDSEVNHVMRDRVKSWSAIAPRLQVWDYVTFHTINPFNYGYPFPNERDFALNYRFYLKNHVDRAFIEAEDTTMGDARDLKIWLLAKILENPYVDDDKLIREFTDGFYGPAATHFRRYRTQLQECAKRNKAELRFFGAVSAFSFLKVDDVTAMQRTFDVAEKSVASNPVLLRRIREARLPLDRVTLFFLPAYIRQNQSIHGTNAKVPFDREAIAHRASQTRFATIKMRLPVAEQQKELDIAQADIKRLLETPKEFPLPAEFKNYKPQEVVDLPAASGAFQNDSSLLAFLIDDPEAPTGKTEIIDYDIQLNPKSYSLPLQWGFYNMTTKEQITLPPLKATDIKGPGYHWYKMGTLENLDAFLAFFTLSWQLRSPDNNDVITRSGINGRYDVWANMKFEGPMHGFDTPGQKNALYVERLILTPAK